MDNTLLGQHLGNYRLVQLLGQGSSAQVYVGEHLHLHTAAAIKVLHARLSPTEEQDFQQEARFWLTLKHPHIVPILAYGITDHRPFLVMERAMKGALSTIHPYGARLSLAQVVDYTTQIADGLGYAHEQGVVHRDLRLENIVVNEQGQLLLGDFGIARFSGTLRGIWTYVAPEQIRGESQAANDQYALAVLIYLWLTGRFPFLGSKKELITQHLQADPPPLRQYNPQISPEVEQTVLVALRKNPTSRFAHVQEFAHTLKQVAQLHLTQREELSLIAFGAPPPVQEPPPLLSPVQIPPPVPPPTERRYLPQRPKHTAPPVTALPLLPQAVATEYWWPTFLVSTEERRTIGQGSLLLAQLERVEPPATFPSQPIPLPVSHTSSAPVQGSLKDITSFLFGRSGPPVPARTPVRSGITHPHMRQIGALPRGGGMHQVRSMPPIRTPGGWPTPTTRHMQRERGIAVCLAVVAMISVVLSLVFSLSIPSDPGGGPALTVWSLIFAGAGLGTSLATVGTARKVTLRGGMIVVTLLAFLMCIISLALHH